LPTIKKKQHSGKKNVQLRREERADLAHFPFSGRGQQQRLAVSEQKGNHPLRGRKIPQQEGSSFPNYGPSFDLTKKNIVLVTPEGHIGEKRCSELQFINYSVLIGPILRMRDTLI